MTSQADQARETARDRATGRFGEQQLADPGHTAIRTDWRTTSAVTVRDETDEDGLTTYTEEMLRGDAEFQRRCRRILGITDDTLPVKVVHTESGVNAYGCDTWEYDEQVTVTCDGQQLAARDLPELLRRLDAADLPRMDEPTARLLHTTRAVISARLPEGRRVTGRLVNFNGWQVLLDDGTRYGCRLNFTQIIGFEQEEDQV